MSELGICVSWGPLRSRHQAEIRCAGNVSGEMPEKNKGRDKEKHLKTARRAFRSQCWADSYEGDREGRKGGQEESQASAQFQEMFRSVGNLAPKLAIRTVLHPRNGLPKPSACSVTGLQHSREL